MTRAVIDPANKSRRLVATAWLFKLYYLTAFVPAFAVLLFVDVDLAGLLLIINLPLFLLVISIACSNCGTSIYFSATPRFPRLMGHIDPFSRPTHICENCGSTEFGFRTNVRVTPL